MEGRAIQERVVSPMEGKEILERVMRPMEGGRSREIE